LNAAVILDDRPARLLAKRLGLDVTGSLGLAVVAKKSGLISTARRVIEALVASGLYASTSLVADALALAGEVE
jgi:uncharacterized protein